MNYDLSNLPSNFDWGSSPVYALLYEGVEFDEEHLRASELGTWFKREPLQGRFITEDGDWAGLPAVFYMIPTDHEYQLVLGYDDGSHDEYLLAFFGSSVGDTPIQVERRGSLIVRPEIQEVEGSPPTYGLWVRAGQA